MSGADHKGSKGIRKPILKPILFLAFIVAAIYLVRYSPAAGHFTARELSRLLDRAGIWAPVAYIAFYAVGICLFLPGTLLTGIGAAVFGPYKGFLYVWAGAMLGASGAFWIGRTLGRGFAASLIGDRLRKYDEAIERNGFAATLYLRLVYFPFTPMNFGMGLTAVRFRDYFLGTALGIIVGTFVLTFLIGGLKDVWVSGEWRGLISIRIFLALALLVFSIFIPKVAKRLTKGYGADHR
ncbi:MAG: TVP38/TMEM64 family protein [Desulfobacteraceae bacterium]|nr:MAG: TVP38/TMEM64 family protein [Desulfobacteraceae bacterium]